MSERLRSRTEHIFSERLSETDDRLAAFNRQLETEVRISGATRQATQAMFDETHKRASEVIQSFERTRAYFTWIGSALSAFVAAVVTIGGIVGLNQYLDVNNLLVNVQSLQESVENKIKRLEGDIDNTTGIVEDIKEQALGLKVSIDNANLDMEDAKRLMPSADEMYVILDQIKKYADGIDNDVTIAITEINKRF